MTRPREQIRIQTAASHRPRVSDRELGFGKVFTDHMFMMEYDGADGRWRDPRVVPYGPLTLDPAAGVLHYGQAMFEGLKAYRFADGTLQAFRLDRHARRLAQGAARLCMPAPDPELFEQAVLTLLGVD